MSIEKIKFHKKFSNPISFEVSSDPVSAKPIDKRKILNLIQRKPVDVITEEMQKSLENWNRNYPKGRKNAKNNSESYKNGTEVKIDNIINLLANGGYVNDVPAFVADSDFLEDINDIPEYHNYIVKNGYDVWL